MTDRCTHVGCSDPATHEVERPMPNEPWMPYCEAHLRSWQVESRRLLGGPHLAYRPIGSEARCVHRGAMRCWSYAMWTDGHRTVCDTHREMDPDRAWRPILPDTRDAGAVVGLVLVVAAFLLCPGCGRDDAAAAGEVALWIGAMSALALAAAAIGSAIREMVRG